MIQKYLNRQTPEMKRLPFEEDAPPTCTGDWAVGCLVAAVFLALLAGWLA